MKSKLQFTTHFDPERAMFYAVVELTGRAVMADSHLDDLIWSKISRIRNETTSLTFCGVDVEWRHET